MAVDLEIYKDREHNCEKLLTRQAKKLQELDKDFNLQSLSIDKREFALRLSEKVGCHPSVPIYF